MTVVDLDADQVLKLWSKVEAIAAPGRVDPETRGNILRLAELVEPVTRAEILLALGEVSPSAVLAAFWEPIYEARCIERERKPRVSRAEATQ